MRSSTRLLSAAVLVLVGALAATTFAFALPRSNQSESRAPLGTGFTFQGRIEIDGVPYTGFCGLEFRLWDSAVAGSQIGNFHGISAQVTNGAFSVVLNTSNQFGAGAFTGDARWLETQARCPNTGAFNSLGRTQLTPVPYATFAMDAQDSQQLGGFPAEDYARFARIIHIPPVAISASNGDALEAAVASISDATQSSPVLVLLEPGLYDVDESLVLPQYVTVAGLDRDATTIRGSVTPLVQLDQQSTLSNLTVEAVGVGPAVSQKDASGMIRSSVIRSGGVGVYAPMPVGFTIIDIVDSEIDMYCTTPNPCTAVEMVGASQLRMSRSDVTVGAFGTSTAANGIISGSGFISIRDSSLGIGTSGAAPAVAMSLGTSIVTIDAVSATVTSGTGNTAGLLASGPTITISHLDATIYTGGVSTGVNVSGSLLMRFSSIRVVGATRYGVLLFGASSENAIEHSTIDASGSGSASPALQSNGTTTIRHTTLIASSASSSMFVQTGTTRAYLSEFRGGAPFSAGTMNCYGSVNDTADLSSTCT